MGIINVLSSEISNKIAAGEVVERPVSVVKELVENSIDAGSRAITVEIKNGGIKLIRVKDNGCGMSADDAGTAFLRHATSKISKDEDLDAIFTLGFRGEALSSIGAVSKIDMYTKQADSDEGTHVVCCGGDIESAIEAGCPNGTCFEVRDLFFNTPARMKFLKKDSTEGSHITDLMIKYILAYPEISFRFISNGKQQLFSPGDGSLKNAIYTVYGRDYANAMVPVEYTIDRLRVTGMIGKGHIARPNRGFQSYFVNKRYIKSPLIIKAVEEAYKNQIMIGKYPAAVLNIDINPNKIDINVHPTKLEVKFSDEKSIYELVYYGVKNALYVPDVPRVEIKTEVKDIKPAFKPERGEQVPIEAEIQKKPGQAPMSLPKKEEKKDAPIVLSPLKVVHDEKPDVLTAFRKDNGGVKNIVKEKPVDYSDIKIIDKLPEKKASEPPEKEEKNEKHEEAKAETKVQQDGVRICGQIFDTYIIAQSGDKMLLIDQHAAHERIKYEQLKRDVQNNEMFSQLMLEPVVVNLTAGELEIFNENKEILEKLGFEADIFGARQVIIRSAPSELEYTDVEELFIEFITQIENNKKDVIGAKQERFMYTVACKAAIKANHVLDGAEMKALAENVLSMENINTCPHGRPIMIEMTKHELEKQFKRIV